MMRNYGIKRAGQRGYFQGTRILNFSISLPVSGGIKSIYGKLRMSLNKYIEGMRL
jgi:hypothetical protein